MSKSRRVRPTIWVGRYLYDDTVYAKTAASTCEECQALIDGGPFYNTVPVRAHLVLPPFKKPTLPRKRKERR